MDSNRKINTVRNTIWGVVNKLLALVFPFIIRTIIINYLSAEYLGLNSLFTSVLQTLSLADLGFSGAIVYSLYKPLAENDTAKVKALLNFYKIVYRAVGLTILGLGLLLLPFLPYVIAGDVSVDINIYVLYAIYLSNTVISYLLFAYKTALLQASQRNDIENKVVSSMNLTLYIIQIAVLILFRNYYYYALTGPIMCIVTNLLRSYIVDKIYPQYKSEGQISKEQKKDIIKRVKALFCYKVGDIVATSSANIIISAFLGIYILAKFSNYFLVITSLFSFLLVYYSAMTASIGNSIVLETKEKNYENFQVIKFLQFWIISWVSICLLCLFQPFINLWVGEEYLLDFPTIILFSIYFYVWKINDAVYVYKDALGMWHPDRFRPIIEALANIVLSIILVNWIGLNGVLLGAIITFVIITWTWMPNVLFRNYFKHSLGKYYLSVFINIITTIVLGFLTYYVCSLINLDNKLLLLLFRGLVCLILPNILFLLINFKNKSLKTAFSWMMSIIKHK